LAGQRQVTFDARVLLREHISIDSQQAAKLQ